MTYDELVKAHEAIGSKVVRDGRQFYVEGERNGRRLGPDGIVLPDDEAAALKQCVMYLEATLPNMKKALGR